MKNIDYKINNVQIPYSNTLIRDPDIKFLIQIQNGIINGLGRQRKMSPDWEPYKQNVVLATSFEGY